MIGPSDDWVHTGTPGQDVKCEAEPGLPHSMVSRVPCTAVIHIPSSIVATVLVRACRLIAYPILLKRKGSASAVCAVRARGAELN